MSIMQCIKCEEMVDTDQEDYDFETLRCNKCLFIDERCEDEVK